MDKMALADQTKIDGCVIELLVGTIAGEF